MEQSAVEWLVEQILNNKGARVISTSTFYIKDEIVEKAKEMQKKNAELIWKASQENMHRQFSSDAYKPISFEKYYEEKFKK